MALINIKFMSEVLDITREFLPLSDRKEDTLKQAEFYVCFYLISKES